MENTTPASFINEQQVLFNLEELIVNTGSSIEDLKRDIKLTRNSIKDRYAQNEDYVRQEGLVREEKKQLVAIKQVTDREGATATLLSKLDSLKEELKDKQETVSECASEFTKRCGKTIIERQDSIFDIILTPTVVRRKLK